MNVRTTVRRRTLGASVAAVLPAAVPEDLREALELQRATSAILRTISRTSFDLQAVLETLIENAARLCAAESGIVYRFDGKLQRLAAAYNMPAEFRDYVERNPLQPGRGTAAARAALERRTVHIPDVTADPDYRYPAAWTLGNIRSILGVPMLREGVPIGVMTIWRSEVRPFAERQIELLTAFADQAAIAIENVRLFNELDARNHALAEALEQRTATGDILRAISQSPTDVRPVFDTIADAALKLCRARSACVHVLDGEWLRAEALAIVEPAGQEAIRGLYPRRPDRQTVSGRVILTRGVVAITDVLDDPEYGARDAALTAGFRSMLGVPLLREGSPIGAIVVGRPDAGPFPPSQIGLLQTFADQAVIAIENVRLFKELQTRNQALTESLAQRTATAEILRVISSSPTDVQPVLDTVAERSGLLCRADGARVWLAVDGQLRAMTSYGQGYRAETPAETLPLRPSSVGGRAFVERRCVHVEDVAPLIDTEYPDIRALQARHRFRTVLAVPMLRESEAIGVIALLRNEVRPFAAAEIGLVQTFADQAVIAIENVRLFHEIDEKGRQLEIANQHKSAFLANMSHELRTPLNAVIGFSQMLAARYFGDLTEKQAEYVNDIVASGKHLLSLINDILDLSKVEAGRMELDAVDLDLRATLDNALTLVRERAQRGGVALRLQIDPALGSLRADERKLKQVVLNLLSNAVKFTPRGGEVRVTATRLDGSARIAVSDSGIGIAPEDQETIFEAFRQVGTDVSRKREGTGLGLTLARRFVELHGGAIRVDSTPGQGATFTITLPIRHGE